MPNPFSHIELSTDDLKRAQKFYQAIFQWTLRPMPEMNYTMIDVGTGTGGGMQVKPSPNAPNAWMPYVTVDDVKKTLAKAKKAGAQIVLDFTDMGGNGAIGVFVDPTGASIGVWQKGANAAEATPEAAEPKPAKKAREKKAPAKKANKAPSKAAKKAPAKKAKKKR